MLNSNEKNRRILVIDDNPAIHEDFRKILMADDSSSDLDAAASAFFGEASNQAKKIEVAIEYANQGEEGVRKCLEAIQEERPFAMAFVDMRMPPGWDGIKTIQHLWEVDPCLQVVICSAYSDHSWAQIQEKLGDSHRLLILKKPFDTAEVLQLASALIEKRHLTEQAVSRADQLEAIVEERTMHLREARRESELLISAIDSILISLNQEGCISRWNQKAQSTFDLTPVDTIGLQFLDLPIRWDDRTVIESCVKQRSDRASASFIDAQGRTRYIGLSSYPVTDAGVNNGTLLLGAELTEQRELESQLRHAQKLESVGQLAAGVAHEINTPMQYIGDNLDFLEKKVGQLAPVLDALEEAKQDTTSLENAPPSLSAFISATEKIKTRKMVDGILDAIADSQDGVQHVSKIVRAMKEFAHPGQEERIPVDINRALDSTISVSTNEWKYVAEVETDFDVSSPTVTALPVELNQVFLNILVNAAHAVGDATHEGENGKGTIRISTRMRDDAVEVAISDSGSGIPDDIKSRIFDPFFTTKVVGKGTGQGLAIAHSVIVNKHGGRIWCESQLGEGTTFYIHIPFDFAPETVSEPEHEAVLS